MQNVRMALTAKQYANVIADARQRHDAEFIASSPPPTLDKDRPPDAVERLTANLWVLWLIIAIAGALISLPHTLSAVLPSVHMPIGLAALYSFVVFLGVEISLLSSKFVSELAHLKSGHEVTAKKQASLAGGINALLRRIGVRYQFDLSHLPDQTPADGLPLAVFLLGSALLFNLADSLADVRGLARYGDGSLFVVRTFVGALGPVLLWFSGKRFAASFVDALLSSRRREAAYNKAVTLWREKLEASWELSQDIVIAETAAAKHPRKFAPVASEVVIGGEGDFLAPTPLPPTAYPVAGHNGNGKH